MSLSQSLKYQKERKQGAAFIERSLDETSRWVINLSVEQCLFKLYKLIYSISPKITM